MPRSSNQTPTFLVLLILTWRIGADVWASIPGHESGAPVMLLLMEMGVLMIALGLLVKRPQDHQRQTQTVDWEAKMRLWKEGMLPYFRRSAEAEVQRARLRQERAEVRAAEVERDRGKYGVRRFGSSSTVPEDAPRVSSATPMRGRFAAETHPVAEDGSGPSSS